MTTISATTSPGYTIHGFPRSLFTRKLEAAFAFYGLPYDRVPRGIGDDSIGKRAGTHQIPVLETPEGWALGIRHRFWSFSMRACRVVGSFLSVRSVCSSRRRGDPGRVGRARHGALPLALPREHGARDRGAHRQEALAPGGGGPPHGELGTACLSRNGHGARSAAEGGRSGSTSASSTPWRRSSRARPFSLGDRPTAVDAMLLGGLHAHTHADPVPRPLVPTRV